MSEIQQHWPKDYAYPRLRNFMMISGIIGWVTGLVLVGIKFMWWMP